MKSLLRYTLPLVLLAGLCLPAAADFTQANLEKMVAELDKVIPENAHYKYPIKCSIESEDQVNAYATVTKEGENLRATMVVYTGLIKEIKGDERLIRAVVAHELSHLSRGHLEDTDPAARDLRNLWTRQQEFEADKFGAEALVKAGYAKKDMVDMLLFLDSRRGRQGDWLGRLTGDHADAKARAAEIADDPRALKALVTFDTGLAYADSRSHVYARALFDLAAEQWPALTVAYINAAHCALLEYYDNLPKAPRQQWWRPDFGPMIVNTPRVSGKAGLEVTDEDRERWSDAMDEAKLAVSKNPGSLEAQEMVALAQVLEPDDKKDVIQLGIAWFDAQAKSADGVIKLRYANNAGVGYQRIGDLQKAYGTIMAAQKSTTFFNASLGENLGLVKVTGRSKDDDTLAANVLFTWLSNTPKASSPRWDTVKKTFDEVCATAGITAKPIEQQPVYLCAVTTLITSNKNLGILLPVSAFTGLLGPPEQKISFVEKWPDFFEMRWHSGAVSVFCERGNVMRVTSYEPGAYLLLKPTDATSQETIQIKVGMSKADLYGILNEKSGEEKELAKGGKVEKWTYFSSLNMGVLIEGDAVKAITVTPVVYEG